MHGQCESASSPPVMSRHLRLKLGRLNGDYGAAPCVDFLLSGSVTLEAPMGRDPRLCGEPLNDKSHRRPDHTAVWGSFRAAKRRTAYSIAPSNSSIV